MNTTYEALERYGLDLVAQARAGRLDPVIGRDEEIRRTIRILSRKTKNNPVLIGEPGVGKTAIVLGGRARIARGNRAGAASNRRSRAPIRLEPRRRAKTRKIAGIGAAASSGAASDRGRWPATCPRGRRLR